MEGGEDWKDGRDKLFHSSLLPITGIIRTHESLFNEKNVDIPIQL